MQNKSVYQFQGVIGTKEQESPDLDVHLIWRYYGYAVSREDLVRVARRVLHATTGSGGGSGSGRVRPTLVVQSRKRSKELEANWEAVLHEFGLI